MKNWLIVIVCGTALLIARGDAVTVSVEGTRPGLTNLFYGVDEG